MQINLSEEQVRELKSALDRELKGLETELVHTDDRTYREGLKASLATLEGIRKRLDARFDGVEGYVAEGDASNFTP